MAEVDVKKSSQSSTDAQTSKTSEQGLQRQGSGTEMSRSRGWDPFGFSLHPSDFFSANPFSMMRRMSEEMDRTFGSFFGQSSSGRTGSWFPAIEVSEQSGQLHVHAELPGLKPEDVKVEVTNDSLILRGERKSEHEHKLGGAYRSERRYGEFYREIPLPEGVNPDDAKAQFRNGVLEVTLPIPAQASNRREIPIQTGETTGTATSAAAAGSQSGSSTAGGSRIGPSSAGTGAGTGSKTGTGT
jgi:HSP20 family protein